MITFSVSLTSQKIGHIFVMKTVVGGMLIAKLDNMTNPLLSRGLLNNCLGKLVQQSFSPSIHEVRLPAEAVAQFKPRRKALCQT